MADAVVPFAGWGRDGWGELAWGVGTVAVEADSNVPVNGLEATGAVGSVTVAADANAAVTGIQVFGSVGTVTVFGDANAPVTGLRAVGGVGRVLVWGRIVPNQDAGYTNETPAQTPSWVQIQPNQLPDYEEVA
jgi:hypothetical protein